MEFKIERDVLQKELATLKKYLSKTVPILGNFLVEADDATQKLTITASDSHSTNKTTLKATIAVGGETVVSATQLLGYLQNLPSGELSFKEDGKALKLTANKKKMSIPVHDTVGFMRAPVYKEDESLEMDSEDFIRIIKTTSFAKLKNPNAQGDYKYEGVQLQVHKGIATFISTDRHRIALNRFTFTNQIDKEFVFSGKSVEDFASGLEAGKKVKIKIDNTQDKCVIECGDKTLYPALYAETFPDVSRYVPTPISTIEIDREELLNSLQLASITNDVAIITADSNGLTIKNKASGVGAFKDTLAATVTTETEVNLRISYFIEGLKAMDTDKVDILVGDPNKPVAVRPQGSKEYAYLLIPMI